MSTQPTTDDHPHVREGPNKIVVTPKWKSLSFWASAAVTAVGIALTVPDLVPDAWRKYLVGFVAIMAGLGFTALHGVAVSAGNQAANRAPGDDGPKGTG